MYKDIKSLLIRYSSFSLLVICLLTLRYFPFQKFHIVDSWIYHLSFTSSKCYFCQIIKWVEQNPLKENAGGPERPAWLEWSGDRKVPGVTEAEFCPVGMQEAGEACRNCSCRCKLAQSPKAIHVICLTICHCRRWSPGKATLWCVCRKGRRRIAAGSSGWRGTSCTW